MGAEVSAECAGSARALRQGKAPALAAQLQALRERLLAVWQAYEKALPSGLPVPYAPELNPPLWELGHLGWFEDYWIARNPQRLRGWRADPDVARAAPLRRQADALYNSSRVPHTRRWHLDLPDARHTLRDLQHIRERSLALLHQAGDDDDALYAFRLVAAHEAMHLEAWVYMAQQLAIDLRATGLVLRPAAAPPLQELQVGGQGFCLGVGDKGFAFDNEWPAHDVAIEAFSIDSAPVTWGRYRPFVEAGGYTEQRWWTPEGWAWRQQQAGSLPRYGSRGEGLPEGASDEPWCRAVFGEWEAVHPDEPALHLSAHEALAWCRWAGRRLPTEAEWECAAVMLGEAFVWGQVWEWTATPFAPYPGFEPHPYRDYSQPWFDGRPVLRGASFATWPAMRHPRYRNYYPAGRNDIFAGFRSCAA